MRSAGKPTRVRAVRSKLNGNPSQSSEQLASTRTPAHTVNHWGAPFPSLPASAHQRWDTDRSRNHGGVFSSTIAVRVATPPPTQQITIRLSAGSFIRSHSSCASCGASLVAYISPAVASQCTAPIAKCRGALTCDVSHDIAHRTIHHHAKDHTDGQSCNAGSQHGTCKPCMFDCSIAYVSSVQAGRCMAEDSTRARHHAGITVRCGAPPEKNSANGAASFNVPAWLLQKYRH